MSSYQNCCFFLLVAFPLAQPAHKWRSNNNLGNLYDTATPNPTGSLSGPWFDSSGSGNVTGVKAQISHLACRIKNLGNQTVSWIRHSDTHLLTTGLFTYTKDKRLSAIHKTSSEDWVLEIRDTQPDDEGVYECQVSTTPPRSHLIFLTVAEPSTSILGRPELHIKFGSRINLTCEIEGFPKPISFVVWYKDTKSLPESSRHSVSKVQVADDHFSTTLIIEGAKKEDTGEYVCSSEAGVSKPTSIHVITGETLAGLEVNTGGRGLGSFILVASLASLASVGWKT